jgi:hypothetical protein
LIEIKNYWHALVGVHVKKRTVKDSLDEIEKTQHELRDSIEQSKRLAERSQALLNRHRREADSRDRA